MLNSLRRYGMLAVTGTALCDCFDAIVGNSICGEGDDAYSGYGRYVCNLKLELAECVKNGIIWLATG